jgi:glycosyltransferase involved in cell wall biosynthesis
MTPKVSIVVLCHMQSQFLHDAVESIVQQTYKHYEVVFACGDEKSAAVAQSLMPYAKLLIGLVHGRADALNRAIAVAQGKYIIRLDADDRLGRTALEEMISLSDPTKLTITTSNMQEFGQRARIFNLGGVLTTSAEDMDNGCRVHCSSLFSRELWEKVGGYEKALFGHEDYDFWIKCSRFDPVVRKVPEVLLYYRIHQEQSLERRGDAVLNAMIRLLNFEPQRPADVVTVARASDEIKAKIRERAAWFPDYEPVQRLLRIAAESDLLCVSMILKDEAHCIQKTIDSCKDIVDRWVILDTGSTDGTQEVLRGLLGDKLCLFEEPFVDFATSRNRALDLCGQDSKFILMLSADEEVREPKVLRQFLSTRQHEKDEAYRTTVEFLGILVYDSVRVMRSTSIWRYVGVTHEVLVKPGGNPDVLRINGCSIVHHDDASPNAVEKKKSRYAKDLQLLSAETRNNPTDTRAWCYLGLTHFWLGNYAEAIQALEKRVSFGGWHEEVFISKLTIARSASYLFPWNLVLERYLEAFAHSPHRAEPLADVTKHYADEENHALAVMFGKIAFEIPLPKDAILFIEHGVYEWIVADLLATHAYYLPGAEEIGLRAAEHAVKHGPAGHMPRLLENLRHSLIRSKK